MAGLLDLETDDPHIRNSFDLAAEAGCWYVYQAIFDTSDLIRNRVKRLKDRGIGVEGTILLGLDDHDEQDSKDGLRMARGADPTAVRGYAPCGH